jgi:hypothetical protein
VLTAEASCASDGARIACVTELAAGKHIAAGRLARMLEGWSPSFPDLYLCDPGRHQTSAAFEALLDATKRGWRSSRPSSAHGRWIIRNPARSSQKKIAVFTPHMPANHIISAATAGAGASISSEITYIADLEASHVEFSVEDGRILPPGNRLRRALNRQSPGDRQRNPGLLHPQSK